MEAYYKAVDLLGQASTPQGFVAAVQEEDNYRRVWTRDSALCGLAALCTDNEELKKTFKRSIESIFQHQHKNGFIPSNVSIDSGHVSYGSSVGRVDNHAWIIISACTYAYLQKEQQWLRKYRSAIDKCFALMSAWEFNGRCLMYVPQSGDWADEYHHHGYILFNQLLRIWALRCAGKVFKNSTYAVRASRLRIAVENFFSGQEYYSLQQERMFEGREFPYWIMGFNTSSLYTQFDLQANALSLLLKIGPAEKQKTIIQFMKAVHAEQKNMLPSFHPSIQESEPAMADLKNNHAFRFRNFPDQFHNGGLWPVWNGLAALAVFQADPAFSEAIGTAVEKACRQDAWGFNECYHGKTGTPIGIPHCAWSAAGLILSKAGRFSEQLFL